MTMTDQEILSHAARLRAARRKRLEKMCEVCGTSFRGIAQRRYCSERCRVAAARTRARANMVSSADPDPYRQIDAAIWEKTKRFLREDGVDLDSADPEAQAIRQRAEDAFTALKETRNRIMHGRVFTSDSTEILREEREKRSRHLDSL